MEITDEPCITRLKLETSALTEFKYIDKIKQQCKYEYIVKQMFTHTYIPYLFLVRGPGNVQLDTPTAWSTPNTQIWTSPSYFLLKGTRDPERNH